MPGNDTGIDEAETLYRRVPVSQGWYDPSLSPPLSPEAFKPHQNRDVDGISLDRAASQAHPEFRNAEQAGTGPSPRGYYIAVLRVGDLLARGIHVVATPTEDNPGHASIASLNSANRKTDDAENMKRALAECTIEVLGPFGVTDAS